MKSYFPNLPNYASFNTRINALHHLMLALLPMLLQHIEEQDIIKNVSQEIALVDAFPIMLCSGKRSAKIAREISDKSFCATKNVYYYGVKMHMIARRVPHSIPLMDFINITPASENDLISFKPILPKLAGKAIFADKAYCDTELNKKILQHQDAYIFTPVKLVKAKVKPKDSSKKPLMTYFQRLFPQ